MTTPKSMLHQLYPCDQALKFDTKSHVNTFEEENGDNLLPNARKNAVQFRCTLSLPGGLTVVSDLFSRKKEAEQDASKKALELMNVQLAKATEALSVEERWSNLGWRIEAVFSEKNVESLHLLREHFKAAAKREGPRQGQVPICAIATLDSRIFRLCKAIDRRAEADPVYRMALVLKAASENPSIRVDTENLCLSRAEPFPPLLIEKLLATGRSDDNNVNNPPTENLPEAEKLKDLQFAAVLIPCDVQVHAFALDMTVKPDEFFLDVIARELGVKDGGRVVFSETVKTTRPHARLYWPAPTALPQVQGGKGRSKSVSMSCGLGADDLRRYSSISGQEDGGECFNDCPKNVRASLLVGYTVYGEVILAAVGGDWVSQGKIYCSDITPSTFYQMMLQRFPQGSYKISRKAILASRLPDVFSSKEQWSGKLPQSLLTQFCVQHRLPTPVFTLTRCGTVPGELLVPQTSANGCDELNSENFIDSNPDTRLLSHDGYNGSKDEKDTGAGMQSGSFMSKVRVQWIKDSEFQFESDRPYRNQQEAQHCAALKALHQLDTWFVGCMNGQYEPLFSGISKRYVDQMIMTAENDHDKVAPYQICTGKCWESADRLFFETAPVEDSSLIGNIPPRGSMVTVRYTVRWFTDAFGFKSTLLENNEKFEFELGSGAVLRTLDTLVSKTSVGEAFCVVTSTPPSGLFNSLAYNHACSKRLFLSGLGDTKYTVQLMNYVEPPKGRMEPKLFNPPLSKQRIQYALQMVQVVRPKSLIDLGCGSGSFLESILDHTTHLKNLQLVGLDISHKSLVRAAKALELKLRTEKVAEKDAVQKIILYKGSITEFDSRLRGADMAVCFEVVEHMDKEPLEKFGIVVLGMLQPQALIVSTPNVEYNPILQGLPWDPSTNSLDLRSSQFPSESLETRNLPGKRIRLSDDGGNRGRSAIFSTQSMSLRNIDHRFEWNRAEFRAWATRLAEEFGYNVKFSGVGGSGEDNGPGYASQIAIFNRNNMPLAASRQEEILRKGVHDDDRRSAEYKTHIQLWQWATGATIK